MTKEQTTPTAPYDPAPNTLVRRVLLLLARNPEAEYSNKDLSEELDGPTAGWSKTLALAVAAGYCKYLPGSGAWEPGVWRAGPNLGSWYALQQSSQQLAAGAVQAAAAQAALVPLHKPPKRTRGGSMPPLPVPDIKTLQVEQGLTPIRHSSGPQGQGKWMPVLQLLQQQGDSVALDVKARAAINAYIKKAVASKTLPGNYMVGLCPRNPRTHCRVMRTK